MALSALAVLAVTQFALSASAQGTNPVVGVTLTQTGQHQFSASIELDSPYTALPWLLHRIRVEMLCDSCVGAVQMLHIVSLDSLVSDTVTASFTLPYGASTTYASNNFWVNATAWTAASPAHDSSCGSLASSAVAIVDDATWAPDAYYVTYYPELLAYCSVSIALPRKSANAHSGLGNDVISIRVRFHRTRWDYCRLRE